ncbi:hypothetical protein [Streptomyces chryseus]|uniref:hypothetical protein n=1 Tax=Streptomyces chryseus TaxID=68186 RepID=UPI0014769A0E|nr:hypothetical protein [Streptomyces chryseus]
MGSIFHDDWTRAASRRRRSSSSYCSSSRIVARVRSSWYAWYQECTSGKASGWWTTKV